MLKSIYKTALLNGQAYDWLDYLTNQIGGRLSGSLNAERAVEWSKEELEKLQLRQGMVTAGIGAKMGSWL